MTSEVKLVSTASTYFVADVEELRSRASAGDCEAAIKLYRYYEFSRPDEAEASKWLDAAAELGDVVSMYTLALRLNAAGKIDAARTWAGLASEHGSEPAKRLLATMQKT